MFDNVSGIQTRGSSSSLRGSILIPCLFILSLISLLTLGVLNIGGVGSSVSTALVENTQARFAAQSGIEIAYERLSLDTEYPGEAFDPSGDASCAVDVTVTDLGGAEYEVLSRAKYGMSESRIRTRARIAPSHDLYPLTIKGNFLMKAKGLIIGDVYVALDFDGKPHTKLIGDLFLEGEREVVYDHMGRPVEVDGFELPTMDGDVNCKTIPFELPGFDVETLREKAIAQGQYYSHGAGFQDRHFDGVLFIDGGEARFRNVTINGTLVADDGAYLRLMSGYLTVRANDTVMPNVAILAPSSLIKTEYHTEMDTYGLSVFDEMRLHGKGSFIGPILSLSDMQTDPHAELMFQCPRNMLDYLYEVFDWPNAKVIELEYTEY